MLYFFAILGIVGDIIAIWLAIHSRKHEQDNAAQLKSIMTEVHAILLRNEE